MPDICGEAVVASCQFAICRKAPAAVTKPGLQRDRESSWLDAGMPVVATNVGCAAEQVVDGITGRLVPRRDPQALADALVELAANPALRTRLARAGREHAA